MKRLYLMTILCTLSFISFGQTENNRPTNIIMRDSINHFIDSVKKRILGDTSKFNRKDLIHTLVGTRNSKPYSQIFLIDKYYEYKLDIINGTLVKEFTDEILDSNKILNITVANKSLSQTIFGINGVNGSIIIKTKSKIKINYAVAGLKKRRKNQWDNFSQRQVNELLIHD